MAGLYVHIPFCRRRCNYCDFYFVTNSALIDQFLAALSHELASRAEFLTNELIETIYFGGGTPSMLSAAQIEFILTLASNTFRVSPTAELTLEANPEDVTEMYLADLARVGINRISLGVQSFNDAKLKLLTREHCGEQSRQTVELAKHRFNHVSVDLIFGTDGETLDDWTRELQTAVALQPEHLSTYSLTVEPRTLLNKLIKRGERQPPMESLQAEMFLVAMEFLRHETYEHYEVSSFSKPNFHSRHNSAYWNRTPYLGVGPSAHSFVKTIDGEIRFANKSSLKDYLAAPAASIEFKERLSEEDIFNETVLLGLRQGKGIDVEDLRKKFNFAVSLSQLNALIEQGLLAKESSWVRLTDKGFTLADEIAAELLAASHFTFA